MSETHIPVLRNEVLDFLKPESEGVYVDATIGLGGHSLSILKQSHPNGRLIGIDMDVNALAITEKRLNSFKERTILLHGNFAQLQRLLESHEINAVDGVLLDLGVSSLQLDTPRQRIQFSTCWVLWICVWMCTSQQQQHRSINHYTSDKLIKIFKEYGEERFSKRIVRHIVASRAEKPITSTQQLARIVEDAYPAKTLRSKSPAYKGKKGRGIHPATRIFQALRIEVNAELDNLALGLDAAVSVLKPGGRLCVISFHSLEDRIVKRQFQKISKNLYLSSKNSCLYL